MCDAESVEVAQPFCHLPEDLSFLLRGECSLLFLEEVEQRALLCKLQDEYVALTGSV